MPQKIRLEVQDPLPSYLPVVAGILFWVTVEISKPRDPMTIVPPMDAKHHPTCKVVTGSCPRPHPGLDPHPACTPGASGTALALPHLPALPPSPSKEESASSHPVLALPHRRAPAPSPFLRNPFSEPPPSRSAWVFSRVARDLWGTHHNLRLRNYAGAYLPTRVPSLRMGPRRKGVTWVFHRSPPKAEPSTGHRHQGNRQVRGQRR